MKSYCPTVNPPSFRRNVAGAVTEIPLEFIDETLNFNPEWVVDKIAPRPILFITTNDDRLVPPEETKLMYERAGEPKKLIVLEGYGHYQIYFGEALRQVMQASIAWCRQFLPAKRARVSAKRKT